VSLEGRVQKLEEYHLDGLCVHGPRVVRGEGPAWPAVCEVCGREKVTLRVIRAKVRPDVRNPGVGL
jgi:hypothetical protein